METKKKELETLNNADSYFKKVNNNEYIKFENVFTVISIIDLFIKKINNDLLIIGENISLKSYYLQNNFDFNIKYTRL